jgi:hypothetical protein
MASLRHLALSFVLLAAGASPVAAGPIEISPVDLCAVMASQFVGGGSRFAAYPGCVGGIPTGIAGGAVALPIAAIAGGVASPWGDGGRVFTSAWTGGAYAGFGVGAFIAGYPFYLVKAAIWDPPNHLACSVWEDCSHVQPDPGVDYRAKRKDVLLNLPYKVYRPNLPVGFEMNEPTLRDGAHGTHDAIVASTVWQATAETTGRLPEDRDAWVNIYQMEDLGLVPTHCPGYDVTIEYKIDRAFPASCSETGKLVNGRPLYRTETQGGAFNEYYALRLGTDLEKTLVVVEFGSEFDESEIAELLPMLENMRFVPVQHLISALEFRR